MSNLLSISWKIFLALPYYNMICICFRISKLCAIRKVFNGVHEVQISNGDKIYLFIVGK